MFRLTSHFLKPTIVIGVLFGLLATIVVVSLKHHRSAGTLENRALLRQSFFDLLAKSGTTHLDLTEVIVSLDGYHKTYRDPLLLKVLLKDKWQPGGVIFRKHGTYCITAGYIEASTKTARERFVIQKSITLAGLYRLVIPDLGSFGSSYTVIFDPDECIKSDLKTMP